MAELIISEREAYCSEHNAMLLLNGYWRCLGTYRGNPDVVRRGEAFNPPFIERTCETMIKDEDLVKLSELQATERLQAGVI